MNQNKEVGINYIDKNPPLSISRRFPGAARMIPGAQKNEDNESSKLLMQHSVPVSIPDWSKIYGSSSKMECDYFKDGVDEDSDADDDDGDGGGEDGRLPPHEWLARKFERSRISSFSVCEGAGRTLKGRDLRRVRDAVLSKTGFL